MTIIEIRRQGGLMAPMAEMRDWLDAQKITPDLFQYSAENGAIRFRVTFKTDNEATAFAVAFDGLVLGDKVAA